VDRNKYQIQIPLPPKIDPTVTMMQVEEKPDVTYSDVGGCKEQIEKLREVVELPLLQPERFINLGIDPPKGVLLYGEIYWRVILFSFAQRGNVTFFRTTGDGQDTLREGRGEPYRRDFHSCYWVRARSKVGFDPCGCNFELFLNPLPC
jgi:hypothetical protein